MARITGKPVAREMVRKKKDPKDVVFLKPKRPPGSDDDRAGVS